VNVESREVEALTRNVQTLFGRIIGLVPYLPEELQIAATNVDDPSALAHLVASTLRLKTVGEAAAPRGGRRREAAAPRVRDPESRGRGARARLEDPVAGAVGDGEGGNASSSCASS